MALRFTVLFLVGQAGHCRHHDVKIVCHCLFCRHTMVSMYCDDIIICSVGKYEVAQSCKFLEDSVTHNCMLHCLSVGFTSCLFMLYTMSDNYCLLLLVYIRYNLSASSFCSSTIFHTWVCVRKKVFDPNYVLLFSRALHSTCGGSR